MKYNKYISAFSHENIVNWRIGDMITINRKVCRNDTVEKRMNFTAINTMNNNSDMYLGGIGVGNYRVCGYVQSRDYYFTLGTVHIDYVSTFDTSYTNVLFDTTPPTTFTVDVKSHTSMNVNDYIYLSPSCSSLLNATTTDLSTKYLRFQKTTVGSLLISHTFGAADTSKNIFTSLEWCLQPAYSSSAYKMYKTIYGSSIHVTQRTKELASIDIQPNTGPVRSSHISRHITIFQGTNLHKEFANFDKLYFVECANPCTTGIRSKDIIVVGRYLPHLYLFDTLGSLFTQTIYTNRQFCLCLDPRKSPITTAGTAITTTPTMITDTSNNRFEFLFNLDAAGMGLPVITQIHPRASFVGVTKYEVPFIKIDSDCKLEAQPSGSPFIRYYERQLDSDCFTPTSDTCTVGSRVLVMEQLITTASNKVQGFAKIDIDKRLMMYMPSGVFENTMYELEISRNAVRCGTSTLTYAFGDVTDLPIVLPFNIIDFDIVSNDLKFSKTYRRVVLEGRGFARSEMNIFNTTNTKTKLGLHTRNIYVEFYILDAPETTCNWNIDGSGFQPKSSIREWTDTSITFSDIDFNEASCKGGRVHMNITVERVLYTQSGVEKMVIPKTTESVYVGKVVDCADGITCDECAPFGTGCSSCGGKYLLDDRCVDTCPANNIQFEYYSARFDVLKYSSRCIESTCGYASTKVYSVCERCDAVCATCRGVSEHQCASCEDGKVMKYGTCVHECDPLTQFENFTTGECSFTERDRLQGLIDFTMMNISTTEGYMRLKSEIEMGIKVNYSGTNDLKIEWRCTQLSLSSSDNDRLFGGVRNTTTVVFYPYVFDLLKSKNPATPSLSSIMSDIQISVKITTSSMSVSRVYYYKLRIPNRITEVRVNSPIGSLPRSIYNMSIVAKRSGYYYNVRIIDQKSRISTQVLSNRYSTQQASYLYNLSIPYIPISSYVTMIVSIIDEYGYTDEHASLIFVNYSSNVSVENVSSVILYEEVRYDHARVLSTSTSTR